MENNKTHSEYVTRLRKALNASTVKPRHESRAACNRVAQSTVLNAKERQAYATAMAVYDAWVLAGECPNGELCEAVHRVCLEFLHVMER